MSSLEIAARCSASSSLPTSFEIASNVSAPTRRGMATGAPADPGRPRTGRSRGPAAGLANPAPAAIPVTPRLRDQAPKPALVRQVRVLTFMKG